MEKKDKFFKIAAYFGIGLWIAGVLLSLLFSEKISGNEIFSKINFPIPQFILLLFIIIVLPLFEEFVFRVWVFRRRITYIFSAMGIIAFLYFIFESWAITISCGLIFILFEFLFKENKTKKRIIFYFIFTGLLFALSHLINFSSNYAKIAYFVQLFGLSLLLGAMGLKYGFLYSFLGHAVYNLIVMTVLHIGAINTDAHVWENDTYKAEIQNMGVFYNIFENNSYTSTDNQIIRSGNLPQIAIEFLGYNNSYYYKYESQPLKYRLKIKIKDSDSFEKNQFFEDLIHHLPLTTDTTKQESYIVSVKDSAKLNYKPQSYYCGTLQNTLNFIQFQNNVALKMKEEQYLKDILHVKMALIHHKTIEEAKEILENYGLKISDNPVGYKRCITFKYNFSDN